MRRGGSARRWLALPCAVVLGRAAATWCAALPLGAGAMP